MQLKSSLMKQKEGEAKEDAEKTTYAYFLLTYFVVLGEEFENTNIFFVLTTPITP